MMHANLTIPIIEPDGADEQPLSSMVTYDPQVEQLMQQLALERTLRMRMQPTPRSTPQREPYAYD
jgi:hypothetical protein